MPARVGREVNSRSWDRQRSKLKDNSLWRRRLSESIQRLAASIRGLACNQATQLFDFTMLLYAISNATKVLELVVQFSKTSSLLGQCSARVRLGSVGVLSCSIAEHCNSNRLAGCSTGAPGISAVKSSLVSFSVAAPVAPQGLSGLRLLHTTCSSFGIITAATHIASGLLGQGLIAIGDCDGIIEVAVYFLFGRVSVLSAPGASPTNCFFFEEDRQKCKELYC